MRNDRSPGVACSLIPLLTTYTKRYNDDGDKSDDDDDVDDNGGGGGGGGDADG